VRRRWNRARDARDGSTWAPILKKNRPQLPDDRIKNQTVLAITNTQCSKLYKPCAAM